MTTEPPIYISDICKRLNNLAYDCRHKEPISRDAIGTLCADAENALKEVQNSLHVQETCKENSITISLLEKLKGMTSSYGDGYLLKKEVLDTVRGYHKLDGKLSHPEDVAIKTAERFRSYVYEQMKPQLNTPELTSLFAYDSKNMTEAYEKERGLPNYNCQHFSFQLGYRAAIDWINNVWSSTVLGASGRASQLPECGSIPRQTPNQSSEISVGFRKAIARAMYMLDVAGNHCEQYASEELTSYDGDVERDGICIAADCHKAMSELDYQLLKTTELKPVFVSLEQCVEAIMDEQCIHDEDAAICFAKAVLDKIGVPYVD